MPFASVPLPDDTLVVRGGQNTPEWIRKGFGVHPSGVSGVSVHSAPGATMEELAVGIPNGQVGVTTVGRVRAAGGNVIRTSGRSPHHATLTGLTPEQMSGLLTPTVPNPLRGQSGSVMAIPSLFADFLNADARGRVRLNSMGTLEDLCRLGLKLKNGLQVIVHDDELQTAGEAVYSEDERLWVARIDWNALKSIREAESSHVPDQEQQPDGHR